MQNNKAIIRIDNITCNYGDKHDNKQILESLSLDIQAGEAIGIIGPNGSGKSTLLKAIAAQLPLASGNIYIEEQPLHAWKPKQLAKQLAFVPQDNHMTFSYTAWQIVMMGRYPHLSFLESEGEKDYEIVRASMEITNTWELRNRDIQALSGGERQRVVLARALTQMPKILLLDEPITALDVQHQVEILNIIKELSEQQQVTVVCVLHDLNLAARYCERLALIHNRTIHALGSPQQVLTKEHIANVYNCNPFVMTNPLTGMPEVTVLSKTDFSKTEN